MIRKIHFSKSMLREVIAGNLLDTYEISTGTTMMDLNGNFVHKVIMKSIVDETYYQFEYITSQRDIYTVIDFVYSNGKIVDGDCVPCIMMKRVVTFVYA